MVNLGIQEEKTFFFLSITISFPLYTMVFF